jgi:hypothetical protein
MSATIQPTIVLADISARTQATIARPPAASMGIAIREAATPTATAILVSAQELPAMWTVIVI